MNDNTKTDQALPPPLSPRMRAWRKLARNRLAVAGGIIVMLEILIALFAGFIAPYDYQGFNLSERLEPPSMSHWFGTDEQGRDILSRVIYGARISLEVGLVSRLIALVIGATLGAMAGYYGKKVDAVVMRLADITLAFPFLLLVIAIVTMFEEQGLWPVFVALGLVGWASMARLIRGQVMTVRELDYIDAARAYGASHNRIIFRHILPNCFAPALIWLTMGMATAIMAEAGLSFLGLGAQPPTPSWGSMINYGSVAMRTAPWLTIFPGLALALTVLGFNLLGDGLRDALDPKTM